MGHSAEAKVPSLHIRLHRQNLLWIWQITAREMEAGQPEADYWISYSEEKEGTEKGALTSK